LTLLGRRGRLPLTHIICGLLFELGLFNFFSSIWAYHLFEMILLFRAKYLDLHYLILFCLILVNHEMNLLVRGIGVCSFVSCYLGDIVRPATLAAAARCFIYFFLFLFGEYVLTCNYFKNFLYLPQSENSFFL